MIETANIGHNPVNFFICFFSIKCITTMESTAGAGFSIPGCCNSRTREGDFKKVQHYNELEKSCFSLGGLRKDLPTKYVISYHFME